MGREEGPCKWISGIKSPCGRKLSPLRSYPAGPREGRGRRRPSSKPPYLGALGSADTLPHLCPSLQPGLALTPGCQVRARGSAEDTETVLPSPPPPVYSPSRPPLSYSVRFCLLNTLRRGPNSCRMPPPHYTLPHLHFTALLP